jgi:hypothetical protein
LVKEGSAIIGISDKKGERPSHEAEYASIVMIRLERTSSQSSGFGNLLVSVDDPAERFACVKIGKIFLGGISTQIGERQNGN